MLYNGYFSEEEKNSVISILKDYISQNITDCDINTYPKKFKQDNCYYKYHEILQHEIQSKFNFTYITWGRRGDFSENLGTYLPEKVLDVCFGNLIFILEPRN